MPDPFVPRLASRHLDTQPARPQNLAASIRRSPHLWGILSLLFHGTHAQNCAHTRFVTPAQSMTFPCISHPSLPYPLSSLAPSGACLFARFLRQCPHLYISSLFFTRTKHDSPHTNRYIFARICILPCIKADMTRQKIDMTRKFTTHPVSLLTRPV